jgi:uncharacterized protein
VTATTFESWFHAAHPAIPTAGALATLRLAEEGATLPFLARYRKEQTGNLDEVALQAVLDAKERWDLIVSRQAFIVEEIERQKKLTPELKERILATFDADALEDLYLPYKQKRKTKATLAREAGLEPLAHWIWNTGHGLEQPLEGQTLDLWAFTFRNEEKGYADLEAVLQGAQDILTERLAEIAELRQSVREALFEKGALHTQKGEKVKPHSKYERYFDHHESVQSLLKPAASHRYLAMRRGWMEHELSLTVGGPADDLGFEERLLGHFDRAALSVPEAPGAAILKKAARLALKAHVLPSIENEVHRELKRVADEVAIQVFVENLRRLLLASPFGAKAVLGVDPGVRTGCKLAALDEAGTFLASEVLQLNTETGQAHAKQLLAALLAKVNVRAIAVGNGTAGRETEAFLRTALQEAGQDVPVVMVSEAGASVYSASAVAREEFPTLDVTVRGAISIARRLQDPLAELVKVEPKSIGVGQYQHDVSGSALKKSLDLVVDSCVNQVGVNVNTASYHLLAHVSGIGPSLAKALVEHRAQKGLFRSRQQLLDVPRFSKKTFEQAAGFLRIPDGEYPLDNTSVHPERYPVLEALAGRLGKQVADLLGQGVELVRSATDVREQVGDFTFGDIVRELEKPGRDPRDEFVPFAYRNDVHGLADLKVGMECPGIVTNVTNFGAFVDIGVHQDGLVHVSQISDKFVKDPREVVHPGLRVQVRVLAVDLEKQQIALTMKSEAARRGAQMARERRAALAKGETPPTRPVPQRRRPPQPAAAGAPAETPRAPQRRPSGAAGDAARSRRDERRPAARPQPRAADSAAAAAAPTDAAARPQGRGASGRAPQRPAAPRSAGDHGAREARRDGTRRDDPRREAPRAPSGASGSSAGGGRGVPLNNPFAVLADLRDKLKGPR